MKYLTMLMYLLLVSCGADFKVGKCYMSTPENKYNDFRKFVFEEGYSISYSVPHNGFVGDPDLVKKWHRDVYNKEVKCPKFKMDKYDILKYSELGILDKLKPYIKEEN